MRRFGGVLVIGLMLLGCSGEATPDSAAEGAPEADVAQTTIGAMSVVADDSDWGIVRDRASWAYAEGLQNLPMGDLMARIGESFLGSPYTAHTLEIEGDERLVVELAEFDCVTFVENVLALARLVKSGDPSRLESEEFRDTYAGILRDIRYRSGEVNGYPSRLHYFSEWISDNDRMGIVRNVTSDLGGTVDDEPIDFMSTHPDAYRQIAESPDFLQDIVRNEQHLNSQPRVFVHEERLQDVVDQIRTGDIIAATSTVKGLDIAHTGIAVWVGDQLHLMHAPLTDGVVEISERPLAERILNYSGQDGVMVARPAEITPNGRP